VTLVHRGVVIAKHAQPRAGLLPIFFGALIAACAWTSASAAAEPAYPVRPVRVIVGFPPGGAADVVARIVGPKMAESFGQPFVVDNRTGAGGTTASELAAHAPPDGYTLLMVGTSHAASAGLYTNLNYDAANSFAAVARVAEVPQVLLANPSLPAKNVGELVALAKSAPGKLNIASGGNGSISHLSGELFKEMVGITLVHVPYKGASLAMADVMTGQVQLLFGSLASAMGQIRSGRLRALGVTSSRRSPSLPDTPTIAEAGVKGYEATGWTGMLAPAGTAEPIVSKLNGGLVAAVKTPEVIAALRAQGAEVAASTPQEFAVYLRAEIAKWTKTIRAANIKVQ
jgi:tripartite-type tricarboxylate transporter receptor subunit TctC